MTKKEKTSILNHIRKAQEIAAKHNLELGNGGDIASMLGGIADEIEMGRKPTSKSNAWDGGDGDRYSCGGGSDY